MGIIELDTDAKIIFIKSTIITYGNSATYELTQQICDEIENMWNEPNGVVEINNTNYTVHFEIDAQYNSLIAPETILQNENPKNNYIRIEAFSKINISFVDGIGSNTGYFLTDNLYLNSTSAAHEYGHTLGLVHPAELNIIGKGRPSIMYPRGTLVNPEFQYDVNALPAQNGGTLYPIHRRVMQIDIDNLQLKNKIENDIFVIGKFSNKYHEVHVKEA
ncbi:MAG TPA: peptidase M10 [Chitinophagales bacterium]|nr:peptidase M10 [Chitinophagales bacterium]